MHRRVLKLWWHKSKTLLGCPKTPKLHTEALCGAGWHLQSYVLWHCNRPTEMGTALLMAQAWPHLESLGTLFFEIMFFSSRSQRAQRNHVLWSCFGGVFFCGGGFEAAGEEVFNLLSYCCAVVRPWGSLQRVRRHKATCKDEHRSSKPVTFCQLVF